MSLKVGKLCLSKAPNNLILLLNCLRNRGFVVWLSGCPILSTLTHQLAHITSWKLCGCRVHRLADSGAILSIALISMKQIQCANGN